MPSGRDADSLADRSAAIRTLRSTKPQVDVWQPHAWLIEEERRANGQLEQALTVFLAGAECPFTCTFCDLWRWTTLGPTPPGALPKQLAIALAADDVAAAPKDRLKLYNASNFFDKRAVPIEDWVPLAQLASPFSAVTVESHASTVGDATASFAEMLDGRLEVAIGLETIHPDALPRLNKRLDLDRFDRAADFLRAHDIDLRVFVLLGTPHVPVEETVDWTVRSVEYAATRGAAVVSIIPVRGGNGEMERLAAHADFTPPTLRQLESALDRTVSLMGTVVTADTWDLEKHSACSWCATARSDRLRRMNLTGHPEPSIAC
ncbi:MAG: hypothetical protein U0163_21660, partial [Gemmatimonadaceae bacterium]